MSTEAWTVTQVDWRQGEYAVTLHFEYSDAWSILTQIFNDRRANGQVADHIEQNHISGDGWEARLEEHQIGDDHAALHGFSIPSNRSG
jgi:hypothetical protein